MMKYARILFLGLLFLSYSNAQAMVSPLGVAVIPPVQFPPEGFTITGARVDVIWGSHMKVYGLDVGAIGNITAQEMAGVQVAGGFNMNKGDTDVVIQAAGVGNFNTNKTHVVGLQVAGLVNSNRAESSVVGVSFAAANITPHTKIYGVQAGLYNRSLEVYGFQIGLINSVESLHGLQIGLVNFNSKGIFAVAPILNVGF